ncbi:hypothetical protein GGS24DRAFT_503908 [Hypoxylon argillaceum]|nr:hypothetical protein GGS24DRAFT_503908 [Hypoxylon argillaceum]
MDSADGSLASTGPSQNTRHAQKRKASSTPRAASPQKKRKAPARSRRATPIPTAPLALPAGIPPVSSNIRAALCDSILFWRAHQGGIQSSQKTATGMLLNGKTTPRDVLGAQVIITTVGGGLQTGADGKHVRTGDQKDDCKNYVTLKNAMSVGEPIGIVIGKQAKGKNYYVNDLLDINLDYHYNVLDFFFITDMWSELQPTQRDGTSFMHYAVRLQRIDLDSTAWWVAQGHERDGMHTIQEISCRKITCTSCNTSSKEIFKEGWCCLTHTCQKFFRFSEPNIDIDALRYNEEFLMERREWKSGCPLRELVPELPSLQHQDYGSESRYKRGIICPTCKYASRRISWEGWQCEKKCGFKLSMPPLDVPMALIQHETRELMGKKGSKFMEVDARIMRTKHTVAGYQVTSFYLPNTPQNLGSGKFIGSVTILHPDNSTLTRKGGLNDLFNEMQKATRVGDVKLQRHPAFCKGSHKEELTSHFSCNMGADYKFGVVVETSNGFESAPDPVMKALGRLTWAGAKAVALTADHVANNGIFVDSVSMPNQFIDFNEQLMLGYFEDSQISFHDDGEKELGPTVATLSLGSPSTMRFRGKKKSGFEDTVAAGNVMLSFRLEHGDIVIMHGTKIHQHYEHAVAAAGIRRYALTCRYIRPEMIPDPERRKKALVNGKVPLRWQERGYKGEPGSALD